MFMEKQFNEEQYMHGYCHFFAIEIAKKYNGKIYLWLDYDEDSKQEFLCHAYTEILPGIYVDAKGIFTSIDERKNEFNFNEINIFSGTIDEICEKLDEIHVSYREPKTTEHIQDFLSNHIITFTILYNDKLYDVGFCYTFKDMIAVLKKKDGFYSNKPILINKEYFFKNIKQYKNFEKIQGGIKNG